METQYRSSWERWSTRAIDIGMWLSLAVLGLWILGKLLGIIHSPLWVNLLPYFSVFLTFMLMIVGVGRRLEKIDSIAITLQEVKGDIRDIRGDMKDMRNDIRELQSDMKDVHKNASCLKGKCSA